MNCKKCNVSVFKEPLQRVNPKGEAGIFWCWNCIRKHEPELYRNLKEEETQLDRDLKGLFYKKR